jgi:hypothetical protein
MSDTTQLFVLAGLWTIGALVAAYVILKWPVKIAVVALLVGIPFWELPYGYYNFRTLCEKEAKLQTFQKVAPQDSICVENLDSVLFESFSEAGFSRIEVLGGSDDRERDAKSGRVFAGTNQGIKSPYCLVFVNNISLPWGILRHDSLVRRANDSSIAARQSQFHWAGMWWQELARPVLGRGGRCFDDPAQSIRAIRYGLDKR